jgi:prepilin-type N-terminal cleavage/methylation domain-containing protein
MRRTRRTGFTLIELLVVIAIIAALMALTASAVMKYMVVQQVNNTQTTLNKVQSVLNRQWSAAKDQAWKEPIPASVQAYMTGSKTNLVGSDANVTARMRVIYVKLRMRQMFPMNFNEAINPAPLQPIPSYVTYLSQLGVSASSGANYESAACLLMALTRAQSGGGVDSQDLAGGGSSKAFALLNSQGVPTGQSIRAFADAWGQPIYFTRVPAGCTLINPIPYPGPPGPGSPGINDPGDPQGYLNALGWPASANTTLFTQLTLQPLAAQNCSYKLAPMLASSGPNRTLEVDPIWFSGVPIDDLFSNP